jgi:hypothetical protein
MNSILKNVYIRFLDKIFMKSVLEIYPKGNAWFLRIKNLNLPRK